MKKLKKVLFIIGIIVCITGINEVYANELNTNEEVLILKNELNIKDSIKRSKYNALMEGESTVTSYNLRDELANKNIELPIKSQFDSEASWAFAFTSMLESSAAKKYNKTPNVYSPMHIEYRTAQIYNRDLKSWGASQVALGYATSGQGPVLEDKMMFEDYFDILGHKYKYTKDSVGNIEKTPDLKINKTIEFSKIFKTKTNNQIEYFSDSNKTKKYSEDEVKAIRSQIKEHIKKYGGIVANLHLEVYPESYYNDNTKSYIFDEYGMPLITKNAVTIVGWDDNYSTDNFSDLHKPLNNGAYIVQNSYGTMFGDDGVFYVSYEDSFIESDLLGVIDLQEKNSDGNFGYDYLYQYDELGMNAGLPITETSDPIYGANVFTKKNKNSDKDEYISEIGLYIYKTSGVEVFVNNKSDDIANATTKVISLTGSNALEAGYHNIKLETPIKIEGDKFVIKVKYINQETPVLPMEINLTESGFYDENGEGEVYNTATANNNEGFYSTDETTWTDVNTAKTEDNHSLKNSSLCIKAFTTLQNKQSDDTNTTNTTDETNTTNTTDETNTTNTTNTTDETNTTNTTNNDSKSSDADDIYTDKTDKTDKTDTKKITPVKTDNTTSSKVLPNTGLSKFIIMGIIITVISLIVAYFKYRNLKDVK